MDQPIETKEIKSLYARKAKESFKARFNLLLFQHILSGNGNPITTEELDAFNIGNKKGTLEKYINIYWQGERESLVDNLVIEDIYYAMKNWREEHKDNLKELLEYYVKETYKNVFPYEDFEEFFKSKNECEYCHLTEEKIQSLIGKQQLNSKKDTRGLKLEIDRKKPNYEYTKDNCVWCCYWCNNAKTDEFSYDEFKKIGKVIQTIWHDRLLNIERHALPDWHPTKAIVLVYPHKLSGREQIVSFYNKFLPVIPSEIKIILLVKDISTEKQIRTWCDGSGIHNEIEVKLFPHLFDIWIRDYAPLTIQEGGISLPVKFLYRPNYVQKRYDQNIKDDDRVGAILGEELINGSTISVEFVWDMGNLTHNGAGIAIVSNKFIADNLSRNVEHELKRMLHLVCGFSKIIVVPTEPEDNTGHVDGMVRFIDEKVLVVGTYPRGSTNSDFMDLLVENLSQDLGSDYTILRLMNGACEDSQTEGIASAFGNHMNFLRLGNKIFIPYYGQDVSKMPIDMFRNDLAFHELDIEVVPVEISEIKELARLGGVLNCITWQVFDS